jgi:hypothetical protein
LNSFQSVFRCKPVIVLHLSELKLSSPHASSSSVVPCFSKCQSWTEMKLFQSPILVHFLSPPCFPLVSSESRRQRTYTCSLGISPQLHKFFWVKSCQEQSVLPEVWKFFARNESGISHLAKLPAYFEKRRLVCVLLVVSVATILISWSFDFFWDAVIWYSKFELLTKMDNDVCLVGFRLIV